MRRPLAGAQGTLAATRIRTIHLRVTRLEANDGLRAGASVSRLGERGFGGRHTTVSEVQSSRLTQPASPWGESKARTGAHLVLDRGRAIRVWRNGPGRQKKHRVVRGAVPVRHQLHAGRGPGLFRTPLIDFSLSMDVLFENSWQKSARANFGETGARQSFSLSKCPLCGCLATPVLNV